MEGTLIIIFLTVLRLFIPAAILLAVGETTRRRQRSRA